MKKYLVIIILNCFFCTVFSQTHTDGLKICPDTIKIFGSKLEVIHGRTDVAANQKYIHVFSSKYEIYSIGENDTSFVQGKIEKHVFGTKLESYNIKDDAILEQHNKNDIKKEE